MTPQTLTNWLQALRSNQYEQGVKHLKTIDNKHCCLGVLCEIEQCPAEVLARVFPPDTVRDSINLSLYHANKYAVLNDSGSTFHEIADIIEQDFNSILNPIKTLD